MTKSYVKEFTINRKLWGQQSLLRQDGKMCCLGFYCKASGCEDEEIRFRGMPIEVDGAYVPKWIRDGGEDKELDVNMLAHINDSRKYSRKVKEQKIKAIFKKNGIKVKFVG